MTSRDTHFDVIIPLSSTFIDSNTVIVNNISISTSSLINIILTPDEFKNLFKCQSLVDNQIVNNHQQMIDNLKLFFNIKSNYKLFASELHSILMNKYPNKIYINLRKLNNLCKTDGDIWNSIFLSSTIFVHPDPSANRNTTVNEEIAIDIKNMIEQSDSQDIDQFWNSLIAQDNITLSFSLDMSAFSTTESVATIFVKFSVLNSTNQYTFNLDSSS